MTSTSPRTGPPLLEVASLGSTSRLLSGRPVAEAAAWVKLLLAFDIGFVVACTLAYPFTVED